MTVQLLSHDHHTEEEKMKLNKITIVLLGMTVLRIAGCLMAFFACRDLLIELEGSEFDMQGKVLEVKASRYDGYEVCVRLEGADGVRALTGYSGTLYLRKDEFESLTTESRLEGRIIHITGSILPMRTQSNPGELAPELYYLSGTTVGTIFQRNVVLGEVPFLAIHKPYSWLKGRTVGFKSALLAMTGLLFQGEAEGVVEAMFFGEKGDISEVFSKQFKTHGIAHIIAISGLHIGILFIVTDKVLGIWFSEMSFRLMASILVMGAYLYLIGSNISAVRACIMILAYRWSVVRYHAYDKGKSLMLCFCGYLILFPGSLFNCGFLLSYGAVFGLFYVFPLLKIRFLKPFRKTFYSSAIELLLVSISVNITTLPVLVYFFNGLSLTSYVANVLVVPVVVYIYIAALIAVVFGFLFLKAGFFAAGSVQIMVSYVQTLCGWMDRLPISFLYIKRPELSDIVVYYALVFLMLAIIYESQPSYKDEMNKGGRFQDDV